METETGEWTKESLLWRKYHNDGHTNTNFFKSLTRRRYQIKTETHVGK